MTKRQIAFGVICFLVGILVGMEIVGNIDSSCTWRCPTCHERHHRSEVLCNGRRRGVRGGSHKEKSSVILYSRMPLACKKPDQRKRDNRVAPSI